MIRFPIKREVRNLVTGEVTSSDTVDVGLILPAPKPGECQTCNTAHRPEEPHNAQSMAYQYRFYANHGRFPDWRDAMAHCSEETRETWTKGLTDLGVDVAGGRINPTPRKV